MHTDTHGLSWGHFELVGGLGLGLGLEKVGQAVVF